MSYIKPIKRERPLVPIRTPEPSINLRPTFTIHKDTSAVNVKYTFPVRKDPSNVNVKALFPIRKEAPSFIDAKAFFPVRKDPKSVDAKTTFPVRKGQKVIHELLRSHHFSYVPLNKTVYTAAYSGCISGFIGSSRNLQDTNAIDSAGFTQIAGAFAKSFDNEWSAGIPDTLQVFMIEKMCKAVWENRNGNVNANTLNTASFTILCRAIIATITESEAYFVTQSIVPDPWPGGAISGTVTSVTAGPGISVTGTPTIAPVVNNTGVLDVNAGSNVSITGTAQHPIVNATSLAAVDQVHAGIAISITGTLADPIVNNTGVTSAIAGTGIGVSGATGPVTFSNTDPGSGIVPIVAAPGFTQPLIGASVSIPVTDSALLNGPSAFLVVETATASNWYEINYILDSTHVVATNLGGANDPVGTVIIAGSSVVPDAPALVTVSGPDVSQTTVGTSVSQYVEGISGIGGFGGTLPLNIEQVVWQRGIMPYYGQQAQINSFEPYDTYFLAQQPGPSPSNPIYGQPGRFIFDTGTPVLGNRYTYIGVVGAGILCAALGPNPGNNQFGQLWLGARFPAGVYTDADPSAYAMVGGDGHLSLNTFGVAPIMNFQINGLTVTTIARGGVTFNGAGSTFGAGIGIIALIDATAQPTVSEPGSTMLWSNAGTFTAWGGGTAYTEIAPAGPGTGSVNTQRLTYTDKASTVRTSATGAQNIGTPFVLANNLTVRLSYRLEGRLFGGGGSCIEVGEIWVQMTGGLVGTIIVPTHSVLLGTPAQYLSTTAVVPPYISVTLAVASVTTQIQFQVSPDNASTTDWEIRIQGDLV